MQDAPVHCTAVRVDQVIPSLASRDAIGVHTLHLRDGLRAAGIDSDIYYGSHTLDVQAEGRPVIELGRATRDRWLLYQASIGSPVYDILAARAEPKLVNYHNITPAELLRDWEPAVAYEVALGRTQLARLAPQSRFAVADSAFNESELQALGYDGTAVVPLLIDMHSKSDEPDPDLARALARAQGARRWRRPPLRREDLAAQGTARPGQDARRPAAHPRPRGPPASRRLAARRDLRAGAARLHRRARPRRGRHLPGSVSGAELEAYFQAADVFVMASDHEGFCVPLAEAMGHGVPDRRLRRHRGARDRRRRRTGARRQVRRALRGGRRRVLRDATLRDVLAAAGRERAAGFDLAASTQRFVSLVQQAVGA